MRMARNNKMDEAADGDYEIKDDESKGQKVWQKLQRAAATKNSGGGGKKRAQQNNGVGSGLGSSTSNQSLNGMNNRPNNGVVKKPPLPDRKNEPNYLEKNMEAIKNKENLTHRYPEKKYEIVHGKNLKKNGPQGYLLIFTILTLTT